MANRNSRMDKYEKRRKNTKLLNYSVVVAALLVFFLIGSWIFGGKEEGLTEETKQETRRDDSYFVTVEEDEGEKDDSTDIEIEGHEETDDQDDETSSEIEESTETDQAVVLEEADSTDENVKEAWTGDWPAIGSIQTGPHSIDYNNGSQDRIEIKKAVSLVTGIPEDDMIEWWVGNGGGEQNVIATVSDREETETFRVYLTWIDKEGWKPTRLETLYVNDRKRN